jgi:putative hemolysin
MTWVDALVVAGLVLANSLYVAAEFGSVGVRRSRIRDLAVEGNGLASRLLPILEDPRRLDRYIATCQIGITLSSLVLGAYGQASIAVRIASTVESRFDLPPLAALSGAALGVLIVLTTFQVVFGELVPKSIALQYPTRAALYTSLPIRWSERALSWFVTLLNGSGLLLLKLIRAKQVGHRHIHSPEEIELLIADSRDGGLLEPEEQRRLHQALRFSMRPARHLMVPRPDIQAIDVDIGVERLVETVSRSPFWRLPVYRGSVDNVVGVINTRDVVVAFLEKGFALDLDALIHPLPEVHENISAEALLRVLRDQKAHMAIVLDEYGGVAGLVTLQDVLAELLGDIADEFKAVVEPEHLPDGRVRVPGRIRLDEAEPWIGVLWRGESDTVGGHITDLLGRLPSPGDRLTIDGVAVEVERASPRAVISVLARPVTPDGRRCG